MVVTYKVSYSNSNDSDEFSWTWNVPDSLNKIFPLCLKMLLHFKKRQVFLAHPGNVETRIMCMYVYYTVVLMTTNRCARRVLDALCCPALISRGWIRSYRIISNLLSA
jgi:hypothetical protein